jgi:hypothetical protein
VSCSRGTRLRSFRDRSKSVYGKTPYTTGGPRFIDDALRCIARPADRQSYRLLPSVDKIEARLQKRTLCDVVFDAQNSPPPQKKKKHVVRIIIPYADAVLRSQIDPTAERNFSSAYLFNSGITLTIRIDLKDDSSNVLSSQRRSLFFGPHSVNHGLMWLFKKKPSATMVSRGTNLPSGAYDFRYYKLESCAVPADFYRFSIRPRLVQTTCVYGCVVYTYARFVRIVAVFGQVLTPQLHMNRNLY